MRGCMPVCVCVCLCVCVRVGAGCSGCERTWGALRCLTACADPPFMTAHRSTCTPPCCGTKCLGCSSRLRTCGSGLERCALRSPCAWSVPPCVCPQLMKMCADWHRASTGTLCRSCNTMGCLGGVGVRSAHWRLASPRCCLGGCAIPRWHVVGARARRREHGGVCILLRTNARGAAGTRGGVAAGSRRRQQRRRRRQQW